MKTISSHGFFSPEALRQFVNLVSAAVAQKAAEAERDAIEALIEETACGISSLDATEFYSDLLRAIRARGTAGL